LKRNRALRAVFDYIYAQGRECKLIVDSRPKYVTVPDEWRRHRLMIDLGKTKTRALTVNQAGVMCEAAFRGEWVKVALPWSSVTQISTVGEGIAVRPCDLPQTLNQERPRPLSEAKRRAKALGIKRVK
jgi:stringent starvation protein B